MNASAHDTEGSLRGWLTALGWVGGFYAASNLILVILAFQERSNLDRWFNSPQATRSRLLTEVLAAEDRTANAASVTTVCGLFLVITLAVVSHRSVKLGSLRGAETGWTPGWAAGVWFIPIFNIFLGPKALDVGALTIVCRRSPIHTDWRRERGPSLPYLLLVGLAATFAFRIAALLSGPPAGPSTRNEFAAPINWLIASAVTASLVGLLALGLAVEIRQSIVDARSIRSDPFVSPPRSAELIALAADLEPDEARVVSQLFQADITRFASVSERLDAKAHTWIVGDDPEGIPHIAVLAIPDRTRIRASELEYQPWGIERLQGPGDVILARIRRAQDSSTSLWIGQTLLTNLRPVAATSRTAEILGYRLNPAPTPQGTVADQPDERAEQHSTLAEQAAALRPIAVRLEVLKVMLREESITQEEHDQQRHRILSEL